MFFLFTIFLGKTVFAQTPTLQTLVDSNEILIGGQFHLKLTASYPSNTYAIKWLTIDSLPHFEVLESSKLDSMAKEDGITIISQTFTLTSFDSGKWNLPVFRVNFQRLNDKISMGLLSDGVPVTVSFSVTDTSSTLKDIKSIYAVSEDYPIWYWIVAVLGLLLLIFLIIWAYRYWKNKPVAVKPVSKLAAYDEAINAIEGLQQYQLSVPEQVKIFHTKLVDIFKKYISAIAVTTPANKSTSDLLIVLNSYGLNKEAVAKTATSLRCSDAVKFAKYLPEAADSTECRQAIRETIELLNKTLVVADAKTIIQ